MFALIQKTHDDFSALCGFEGTPSEIALEFLRSGIDCIYQQARFALEDMGDIPMRLNTMKSAAEKDLLKRSDIDDINITLSGWNYVCVGTAENSQEANAICDMLDSVNQHAGSVLKFHRKKYEEIVSLLRNNFTGSNDQELHKALRAGINLKLL